MAVTTKPGGNAVGAFGAPSDILGLHYTTTAVDRQAAMAVRVSQDKLDRLLLDIDDACRHLSGPTATMRMLLRIIGQVSFALFARPVRAQMALLDRLQRPIPPLGALHPATLLPKSRQLAALETLAGLRALTTEQLGVAVLLAEEQILAPTVHILTDTAKGTTTRGLGGLTLFPDSTPAEAWMPSDQGHPQIAVLQTIMKLEL